MTAPPETHPTTATRYTNLIYAAALRQTKDPHLAADITQAVFLVLLKKSQSGKAPEEQRMTGWLLQVTHYIIRETRRASFRRHHRERQPLPTPAPTAPSHHPEITDLLDTALLTLHPTDRELIARRYLHEEPLDSLAAALSLSPNTTTKRLTRALEKLRTALNSQGITTAALTSTLATQANIKSPTATTTATPLAHHLARRVLLHSFLTKTVTLTTIAAAVCLITAITAYLTFRTSAPAPTPTVPTTTTATDNLIHIDKILEPASDQLLAQTLAGIHDYLSKLKTLQLDATYTIHWPDSVHGASADSQTVGTGWIDAHTGRFRMEISLGRAPFINGATQTLPDNNFTEVWDGAQTRVLQRPPYSTPRGEILSAEPSYDDRMLLGTTFSTEFMQNLRILPDHGRYFIESPFDEHSLSQLRLTASRVIINHHESVELETHFKLSPSIPEARRPKLEKFAHTFWFDPSRGYALLAFQDSIDGDHIAEQRVIDELTEAAPGIFYPTRAHSVVYARDPEKWILWCTGDFRATRVIANQPLAPTLFHLDFPPGIPISDAASSQPATQP